MNCRFCGAKLSYEFIDLVNAPPSNAFLTKEQLKEPEIFYPLKLYVCNNCWLVQTEDYTRADELFRSDYAYFSSTSTSWLQHIAQYCDMVCDRFQLNSESFVIEIASNDGYLLKNIVARNIPCLGIEPTDSTAKAAEKIGIPVLRKFFGAALAKKLRTEGKQADLLIGNNVYAHVPDIKDFTYGLKEILKPKGVITLEFPHLMNLIEHTQFDTIYHEHYSYLSLFTVSYIFESVGLRIFDVEKLQTHGGSLRIYGCHSNDVRKKATIVSDILDEEEQKGLRHLEIYEGFQQKSNKLKNNLLAFLIEQKRLGKSVAAYGAAAKGNTFFNYAGVKQDLISFVCDAAHSKQGKFLPGSHIPIVSPDVLKELKPDIVLILPWNIANEIIEQYKYLREWGGVFIVAIPEIKVLT